MEALEYFSFTMRVIYIDDKNQESYVVAIIDFVMNELTIYFDRREGDMR